MTTRRALWPLFLGLLLLSLVAVSGLWLAHRPLAPAMPLLLLLLLAGGQLLLARQDSTK